MKKNFGICLSLLMCFSLLITMVGTVSAESISASGLPQPTITPLTGNPTYTTKLLSLKDMPGVTALDNGRFAPTGYTSGEKQFEGQALQISSFADGSATLCFAFNGASSGWGGQIATWDGSKWVLLPTTITSGGDEVSYSWGCTAINSSGTYAFLKWIADPDLLANKSCGYAIVGALPGIVDYSDIDGVITGTIMSVLMITDPSVDIGGKDIKVAFSFDPKAISISPASTRAMVVPWGAGFFIIGLDNPITFSVSEDIGKMYIHLDFGSCKQTVTMSIG
jgi:hypothetical protein